VRKAFQRLVGLAILATSTASQSAPHQPLQASKPWVLDYGETQCNAMREYDAPGGPITLAISPATNGETYRLLVARKHKSMYSDELEGSIDFGSGPAKAWLLRYPNQKRDITIEQFRVSASQFAQIRSAKTVKFSVPDEGSRVFAIENMANLLEKMEICRQDLRAYWNMDGDKKAAIATPPTGDIRSDFSGDDYPGQALQRRQQGNDVYLLMVDQTGIVAGCDVLEPSGVPVLDAMGCAVIQERTRMQPARDKSGKPVRSTEITRVFWRLN
jgi:TonB family protein